MIRRLMELAISGRAVIIGLAIALLLSGIYAFSQLDIEAYPDPVQPMVELLTLPNGLSAEEVERLVTVPLEYTLSSTRNLESMRHDDDRHGRRFWATPCRALDSDRRAVPAPVGDRGDRRRGRDPAADPYPPAGTHLS